MALLGLGVLGIGGLVHSVTLTGLGVVLLGLGLIASVADAWQLPARAPMSSEPEVEEPAVVVPAVLAPLSDEDVVAAFLAELAALPDTGA